VRLFGARDEATREAAWAEFAQTHTRLLLHVARSVGRDYDAAMDAYAFVLEKLREEDFRRLRCYAADGRSKFTTWLVVVVRRLCLDYLRERYGRVRETTPEQVEGRQVRKRLVDLIAVHLDVGVEGIADDASVEAGLLARERADAIAAAVSALGASDQLLLKLRFEDDLSAREIARLVGLPTPFHVYRRLNLLREELRRALKIRGVDEGGA
jgi:RNA polymerase sigma factor (sigma-70 family)